MRSDCSTCTSPTPTLTSGATAPTASTRRRTRPTRTLLLVTGAVAAGLVLAACGGEDTSTTTGTSETTASSPSETAGAAADHNAADVMFATMMIPHHAQAVEMASTVLAKDDLDPRVTQIAEQIQAAQAPEIELMSGWLRAWDEPVPDTSGSMPGTEMDGMAGGMSEADMQALQDAPAAEAAPLFLEQMTEHHSGAIEMARAEVADGRDPAAVDLARTIAASQQEEITRMRSLREQL